MVEFAGWQLPVEYEGLRAEHNAVRTAAGLFDVSHMGEVRIRGPKALETTEWLTTNFVGRLKEHQAQYSLLPNETGGLVDDIIVYCVKPNQDYFICVNAANTAKDFEWMKAHNRGADIIDESNQWGQLAIQGPKAVEITERVFKKDLRSIESFTFAFEKFEGAECLLARTGYTGEDGFEIFVPAPKTVALWRALLKEGQPLGLRPAGLGARDTLRTEMKFPLYGHEIDESTNPYSAGLGWVVKPKEKDFLGRSEILGQKERGLTHKLVGFKMIERGIPRQGYKIFSIDEMEIGVVTSGTVSPTLNENIGIGYVRNDLSLEGERICVEMRGRKVQAEVVSTPFVKKK